MTFTLGYKPEKFKVEVSADSDFFGALQRKDGEDWDDGLVLTLDFEGDSTDFDADIAGANATWQIDETDVNDLIAAKPKWVKLWYVQGTTKLLWGVGSMVVTK